MRNFSMRFLCCLVLVFCLGHINVSLAQDGKAENDTIVIGINVPLSGPYQDQGLDQRRAYQLAVDGLNARGGVLGREVEYIIKDTEVNPEVATHNALELIQNDDVDMITGGSSSAVAIAQSEVCQKNGVVFMAALTHSSVTTGFDHTKTGYKAQKAHRHTFRWYLNDWMTKEALVPFLIERFGTKARYFYISADYIWGYSLEKSIRLGTGLQGGETVGSIATPLGSTDFSGPLAKVRESKADILILNLFGQDLIHAMQQAREMELNESLHIVAPLMEINMAHAIDNEVLQNTYSTTLWYQSLQERYARSKSFVQSFSQKYNRPPGSSAASAWVAVHQWAKAVERASSTEARKVIPQLEGHMFNELKGTEQWRSWDHQAVSSVFILQGKAPVEMADEWDLLKIVDEVPGNKVVRTRSENPVMLEFFD